jgi:hypothetical protein
VDREEQRKTAGGVMLDWYTGMETDIDHDVHIHENEGFWFDFDLDCQKPLPDGRLRLDYLQEEVDPDNLRVFQHFLIENMVLKSVDGTVRLASSDCKASPAIDLALYKNDDAVERLAKAIQLVRRIAARLSDWYVQELFPGPEVNTLAELKEYIKRWSVYGHHAGGTAKMGQIDDPMAVLDSKLQVRGIGRLRVCDASVFPYLPCYNPSRAIYMVAEKCADIIKEEW